MTPHSNPLTQENPMSTPTSAAARAAFAANVGDNPLPVLIGHYAAAA